MKDLSQFDYFELRNDGRGSFSVLGFGTYEAGSVLAGAPKKVFVKSIEADSPDAAMEIAQAEFGEMNWYHPMISANADAWINSLPDEGDLY